MPELLAAPQQDRPGSKKLKKKKEEKAALIFDCSYDTEIRPRPSRYADFLEDTTLADYLYQRKREREVVAELETNEDRLEEEDPERLAELRTLRESLRSEELPYFRLHYHPDLLEEAAKTVPFERSSEPEDKGEYFVLSEEDRLRLEAMFTKMSAAEGETVDDGAEVDERSEGDEGSEVDEGEDGSTGDKGVEGDGEEELELERESEQESGDEGRSYDDDGYSDTGSVSQDVEAEAENGKPKGGHFSRWETAPMRLAQANPSDKKGQKFKPRLNVVWQKRLENSKVKKDEPVAPVGGLPPPGSSLFNNMIPKKYRRKPKSRLGSIAVPNSRKPEPASVEIGNPRQNRSSELRLQKRLLQEAKARGNQPRRRRGDGGQRRLRRSQSHSNVARESERSMRRATSLRNLPSHAPGRAVDASQSDHKEETSSDGQTRKGTPHPGRRAMSAQPPSTGDSAAEEGADEEALLDTETVSLSDAAGDEDMDLPPVSV